MLSYNLKADQDQKALAERRNLPIHARMGHYDVAGANIQEQYI